MPMHIKGPDSRLWPAKFTKVEYTDNPHVCGYCAGSPTPYSDYLYAEPVTVRRTALLCLS
jgi:hypothetical protein